MHDSTGIFWVAALVILGLLIYGFFFSNAAIVKRRLKAVEEKPLSTLQDGDTTKVKGTVVMLGRKLTAPLSGRPCAYYHVLVEEQRSSGKSSSWHNIIEEEVSGDLVLKAGDTYVVVDTSLVKSHLVDDAQYKSGIWNDASRELEDYLVKHDRKSIGFLGMNKTMRYREGILEEGETVAVAGTAHWKNKSAFRFNIPKDRVLVLGAGQPAPLYLSDDPEVTS